MHLQHRQIPCSRCVARRDGRSLRVRFKRGQLVIVGGEQPRVPIEKRLMRRWERLPLDEAVQAGIDSFAQSVAESLHGPAFRAYTGADMLGAERGPRRHGRGIIPITAET